jgi:hypothetical protein
MRWDRFGPVVVLVLLPAAPARQDGSRPAAAASRPTSVLVPVDCGTRLGGTNNAFPFSARQAQRYQALLSPEAFADHEPGPLVITGVGFRGTGGGNVGSRPVEVELRIGTLPGSGRLEDASKRFADNLGADALVVFARGKVEVGPAPERSKGKGTLDVWDVEIRFQRPFTYRRDRALVLDFNVSVDATFSYPLDAHKEPFATRVYGAPDAEEGVLQESFGLVTRFLLKPRAESRPASGPGR